MTLPGQRTEEKRTVLFHGRLTAGNVAATEDDATTRGTVAPPSRSAQYDNTAQYAGDVTAPLRHDDTNAGRYGGAVQETYVVVVVIKSDLMYANFSACALLASTTASRMKSHDETAAWSITCGSLFIDTVFVAVRTWQCQSSVCQCCAIVTVAPHL